MSSLSFFFAGWQREGSRIPGGCNQQTPGPITCLRGHTVRRGGNSDLARGGLLMNTRIERDRRTVGRGDRKMEWRRLTLLVMKKEEEGGKYRRKLCRVSQWLTGEGGRRRHSWIEPSQHVPSDPTEQWNIDRLPVQKGYHALKCHHSFVFFPPVMPLLKTKQRKGNILPHKGSSYLSQDIVSHTNLVCTRASTLTDKSMSCRRCSLRAFELSTVLKNVTSEMSYLNHLVGFIYCFTVTKRGCAKIAKFFFLLLLLLLFLQSKLTSRNMEQRRAVPKCSDEQ